jgi:hypothetical protein
MKILNSKLPKCIFKLEFGVFKFGIYFLLIRNFEIQKTRAMGLPELKDKIRNQLDLADERVLRIVSSVFDNYLNEVVSYDSEGNPLTLSEYHNKVEEGLEDVKYNRIISKEDLSKEMQDWDNE